MSQMVILGSESEDEQCSLNMFIDCRKLCGAYLFLLFACEHASTLQSTQLVIGVMFTDGCDRNTLRN